MGYRNASFPGVYAQAIDAETHQISLFGQTYVVCSGEHYYVSQPNLREPLRVGIGFYIFLK